MWKYIYIRPTGREDLSNPLRVLIGMTMVKVEHGEDEWQQEEIVFTGKCGNSYRLYHDQDCCESVYVESIVGDLDDLVGTPILRASEDRSVDYIEPLEDSGYEGSHTWTFYNLSTIRGTVTIRWYGSSNGYYSESVTFKKVN